MLLLERYYSMQLTYFDGIENFLHHVAEHPIEDGWILFPARKTIRMNLSQNDDVMSMELECCTRCAHDFHLLGVAKFNAIVASEFQIFFARLHFGAWIVVDMGACYAANFLSGTFLVATPAT